MNVILHIHLKDNQGDIISLKRTELVKAYGIKDDLHGGKEGRNISIISNLTRDKINMLYIEGLCMKRFKENIRMSREESFKAGDVIRINNALLKITSSSKKCFKECDLYRSELYCPLREVIFADVLESGIINVGDEIKKI